MAVRSHTDACNNCRSDRAVFRDYADRDLGDDADHHFSYFRASPLEPKYSKEFEAYVSSVQLVILERSKSFIVCRGDKSHEQQHGD